MPNSFTVSCLKLMVASLRVRIALRLAESAVGGRERLNNHERCDGTGSWRVKGFLLRKWSTFWAVVCNVVQPLDDRGSTELRCRKPCKRNLSGRGDLTEFVTKFANSSTKCALASFSQPQIHDTSTTCLKGKKQLISTDVIYHTSSEPCKGTHLDCEAGDECERILDQSRVCGRLQSSIQLRSPLAQGIVSPTLVELAHQR